MKIQFQPHKAGYEPEFRALNHIYGAYGGSFGLLNMLLAAITIVRQLVSVFNFGVAPLLRRIFAAYVYIFHGSIDYVVSVFAWLFGFKFALPVWAHDGVVVWFIFAGACFRLVQAADRSADLYRESASQGHRVLRESDGNYGLFEWIARIRLYGVVGWKWEYYVNPVAQYFVCLVVWPILLVQAVGITERNLFYNQNPPPEFDPSRSYSVSYGTLLMLQVFGVAFSVFMIAFFNAQLA